MKQLLTMKLVFALLVSSLSSWAPVVNAAPSKEQSISSLVDKLEDLGTIYKADCLPKNKSVDIKKYHEENPLSEQCWKYITEINHLETELQKRQALLESKLGCQSGDCKTPTDKNLDSQMANLSKVNENLTCSPEKRKAISSNCEEEIGCSFFSGNINLAIDLKSKIFPKKPLPKKCDTSEGGCGDRLFRSFYTSAISFFKGAWTLTKMAGSGVGNLASKFWDSVKKPEAHSSTSQLALAKASEDPGIFNELINDFPGSMKKIWTAFVGALKVWIKEDAFCQKWSGKAHISKCIEPADQFDCLSCGNMINGLCAVSGTLVAEIVPAFLTGGLATAIKHGINGSAKIARGIKVSSKAREAFQTSKLGNAPVSKLTTVKNGLLSDIATINKYTLSPLRNLTKSSYGALASLMKKGSAHVATTPVGKVISFSGQALKKTAVVALYPIDNPMTGLAYKLGGQSIDKAFKLGKPKLAAETGITLSIASRNPEINSLAAEIDELKHAPTVNEQKLLKKEAELLHQIKSTRSDILTSSYLKGDPELSEIIQRLYPELQFNKLSEIVPKADVIAAEKELYLALSKAPNPNLRKKLLEDYKTYLSGNVQRGKILAEAKTPFDGSPKQPLEFQETLKNYDVPPTAKVVALENEIRTYMDEGYEAIKAKALKTEKAIKESNKPVVFDSVAHGAGPNSSMAVGAMTETDPGLKVLVIEATDSLGTFHRVKGFDINTPELVGQSGNNFPTSSVQLKDFNVRNASFVPAENVGYMTQSTLEAANVDLLLNNKIVKWSQEPTPGAWPGKFKIETDKGIVVYANSGVISQGIGEPVYRMRDADSLDLINKSLASDAKVDFAKNASYIPRQLPVEKYIEIATKDARLGRDAVGRYKGKKTLVVGDGDGGSIAVETATGINKNINPNGTPSDVEVVWLGQASKTKAELLEALNSRKDPRYGRIGDRMDAGQVNSINGYLQKIEEFKTPEGDIKYRAFYTMKKGDAITEPIIVDNIVYSTGYNNKLSALQPSFNEPVDFVPLKGKLNEYTPYATLKTKTESEINKQLTINGEKQDIFVVGIGSNSPVSKRKWKAVTGGYLDITGARAAATGNLIAEKLRSIRLNKNFTQPTLKSAPGKVSEFSMTPVKSSEKGRTIPNVEIAEIHTKLELGKSLREFKSAPNSEFKIFIVKTETDYKYAVQGLDPESAKKLVNSLATNPKLTHGFEKHAEFGNGFFEIKAFTRSNGAIKSENLQVHAQPLPKVTDHKQPLNWSRGIMKFIGPKLMSGSGKSAHEKE